MAFLEVRNVGKHFGGIAAVTGLSFDCSKGDRLGIIGPNGAGKTTAFSLISGFLTPDEGTISFEGQRIDRLPPEAICKRGLCRTFQITQPFPNLSVLHNILVAAYLRHPQHSKAMRKAEEIVARFGFQSKAHLPAGKLNVADRKRLELARACATEPQMILMDEVGAGLTGLDVGRMIEMVVRLNEEDGVTFLIVEHIMAVIKSLAKRVIVLDHGIMIGEGTPQEISRNPDVIEAYLGDSTLLA